MEVTVTNDQDLKDAVSILRETLKEMSRKHVKITFPPIEKEEKGENGEKGEKEEKNYGYTDVIGKAIINQIEVTINGKSIEDHYKDYSKSLRDAPAPRFQNHLRIWKPFGRNRGAERFEI